MEPTKSQKKAAYVDGINEQIDLLYKEVDFRVRNINSLYEEIMKL